MARAREGIQLQEQVAGSGVLTRVLQPQRFKATYQAADTKDRHGFFRLGWLSGRSLEPGCSSVLKFETSADVSGSDNEVAFVLFLRRRGAKTDGADRLKFFSGAQQRAVSFVIDNELLADDVELVLRVHQEFAGRLSVSDLRLIGGVEGQPVRRAISDVPQDVSDVRLDRSSQFLQVDDQIFARYLEEEICFSMPPDWDIASVSSARLNVVDDFLFGPLRQRVLGVPRRLNAPARDRDVVTPKRAKTILSFSTGEDSTAALSVLPSDTPTYFCKRAFSEFHTSAGRSVVLERRYAEEHALARVPSCLIIENDMELYATKFGGKMGNPATAAVVVVGVLLADYVGAGSIAIGAQLETSFLQNGQLFVEVDALPNSAPNKYRRLLNPCELDICYPVAALSEVLTNRVVMQNSHRFLAVSCPDTSRDLQPCGSCYKCFRKLMLSGGRPPTPDAKTRKKIAERPLKMATSAIYAASKAGYPDPLVEEYADIDLSFLERYYDEAVEALVPENLRSSVRARFEELGLQPMSPDDVTALKAVGQRLAPEAHRRQVLTRTTREQAR